MLVTIDKCDFLAYFSIFVHYGDANLFCRCYWFYDVVVEKVIIPEWLFFGGFCLETVCLVHLFGC